ncbi:MAG: CHAP domain-containing protein [Lachnospiraceae bacterium]|nr:CHAP domain-containing protein [Lachnospiraceae bacterium]
MLKTNVEKMEKIDISVDSYVTEVKNLANRMKHVYAVIEKDSYGMNTEKVKQKIEHWYKVMEKEAKAIENMGTGLEKATVKYRNMENDVISYFTGVHAEKVTMKNNAVDQKAAEKKTGDKYKKDKIDDSLYKNSSTAKKTAVSGSGKGTPIKSQNQSKTTATAAGQKAAKYALSQIGYQEKGDNHTKYNQWYYGKDTSAAWCAIFTLNCLYKGGLTGSGKVVTNPHDQSLASAANFENLYKNKGKYKKATASYTPKAGDTAFFYSASSNSGRHVGIVTDYNPKTKTVTVVEGNSSDQVKKRTYVLGKDTKLLGFGVN